MNIQRAKQEIVNTVRAYLARDARGDYAIPAVRQRPILLMGPPGIGKTQIMEQAARECGIAIPSPTTRARAPWACPLSGSAPTAAGPFPLRNTP